MIPLYLSGFGSQGKLKRVDLAGGQPQTLCEVGEFRGGTWSSKGVILFAPRPRGGLFQVLATGGEPKPVTDLDLARQELGHLNPYFLPDGRHFLYRVEGRGGEAGVFVSSLDSKEVKQVLTDGTSAIYGSPGWLLFVRNGALLAQPFDAEDLALKDEAFPLTRPTNLGVVLNTPFSVSDNGVLIWQGDRWREYQLVWFDRAGRQDGTLGAPIKTINGQAPRLSPDGKRVAIQSGDPQNRNVDVWVIDLTRNLPTRLTSDPAFDLRPIWSPDNSRVVFGTIRGDVGGLYQKAASGMGTEELLLKGGGNAATDWSPDGRFIIYSLMGDKTRYDVWALPLIGSRQPYQLINTEFNESQAQLSPTGANLAYVSDESGRPEVYVQPFSAEGKLGSNKVRISANGGKHPRFRRDGRELFYVAADGQMMAVKLNGATFETPKALFKTRMLTGTAGIEYDVTADGQRFLIGTMVGEPAPVNVILNWAGGLKH